MENINPTPKTDDENRRNWQVLSRIINTLRLPELSLVAEWGRISGSVQSQTDLMNFLDKYLTALEDDSNPKLADNLDADENNISDVAFLIAETVIAPEIKSDASDPADLEVVTGDEKTLELQNVVWDDIMVGQVRRGVSSPDWEGYKGTEVLAFDKGQSNKIYFNVQFPHRIKVDSTTEFHLHVAPPDNNGGGVVWELTVSYASIGGTFGSETTIKETQTIEPDSQDKHLVFTITEEFTENTNISGFALCSLTRLGNDGDDNYDNDIYLVGLDSHYQVNTMGSRQMHTK